MKSILHQPIYHQTAVLMRSLAKHLMQGAWRQDPRILGGIGAAVVLSLGGIWWYVVARRPSAEEMERRRREGLARSGRITDGVILDARTLSNEDSISPTPEVLIYSYSLAGLTYNCAQDVSTLGEQVLGFRIDQPVQVRYDPRNPGNSIIVSETWTGLWLRPREEAEDVGRRTDDPAADG
ncbi:MAG: DUF3592 domain-containing protein [Acidobacteriaceae bacterium]